MKAKLLKKLRERAKKEVYLTHYYSGNNKISIVYQHKDGEIRYYDISSKYFTTYFDKYSTFLTVEEALPHLQEARRIFIRNIFKIEYRSESKGEQKKRQANEQKNKEYQKYLQQY